jgi:uncharacterized repeat protein (TIGR01451 family)
MRTTRAVRALSFLIVAGQAFAAPAPKPAAPRPVVQAGPWSFSDEVLFTRARAVSEPWRDGVLIGLLKRLKAGRPFAPEERAILDAYNAGLAISQLEADVLASRALYNKYVAGKPVSPDHEALLERYKAYTQVRRDMLFERSAVLHRMAGKEIAPPEDSRDWELYSNPELFNQLDGTRHRLEAKFGRKGGLSVINVEMPKGIEALFPPPVAVPKTILPLPGPLAPTQPVVNNNTVATGGNAGQDTQSETSILLLPGGVILAGFNDSGGYSTSPASNHFTGWSRSTDGGATWTDLGTLPNSTNGDAGDPTFARSNATGTVIYGTLGFTTGAVLPVFRSTDGGATFGNTPANGAAGGGNHDKEILTADNFTGAAGSGYGNFYMFWRDFGSGGGMTFTRSTDDGLTFTNRQVLAASSGQGAWPVVGADHAVYAFWLEGTSIVMRKSTDQAVTFGSQSTVVNLSTTGVNGDLGLGGGFRTNAFPQVVAHPTDATQLYMVYNDKSGADKGNIYFVKTADGGATWSAPVKVNNDAGTNDQWQPVISITPDGGRLFVSWYDRRMDVANNLFEVFGRCATISGSTVTWDATDFRITDGASPVVIGQDPVINSTYMGDYDQATADNTNFYRTWADNRLSNGSHVNQPDVRFAAIPRAGLPPEPPAFVPFGYGLTAEGCAPANNAPDPGEVVTFNLTVKNTGGSASTNLVGTLQATGGVTSPSGPQTYGAIAPGSSVTKAFTYTVNGSCGGTVTMSLQLQDGATNYGTVTFPVLIGPSGVMNFSNSSAITINDNAAGSPYPSNITVSGISTYSRVTVTLNGFSHTFPDDVDVILVAPGGQKAYVMSDVGGSSDAIGITLTLDDLAAASLPDASPLTSGTFKPTNIGTTTDTFPAPAPAAPYSADFSVFSGLGAGANGIWSLYVRDDLAGDVGSYSGGWTLTFQGTPSTCVTCTNADLSLTNTPSPNPVNAGSNITYTYVATNNGPDAADNVAIATTVPSGTTFVSATASGATLTTPAVGGTGAVNASWAGATANGGTRTLTMVVNVPAATPDATIINNSASATSSTPDSNGVNNTNIASAVTVVNPMPTITSFTPTSGFASTLVTIYGTNFTGASSVKFNGASAVFTVNSNTQITAMQPSGATTGLLSVTNPYGTAYSATPYTILTGAPRIWVFTPTSGATGAEVVINGSNLGSATSVKFNGTAATFTVLSATSLKAIVPAGATTGPISVTNPSGTSTSTGSFTKL